MFGFMMLARGILVRRFLAVIILIGLIFAVGSPASAQTATPTPGPIFGPGYYESNASGVATPSGTWSTTSDASRFSGGSIRSSQSVGAQWGMRMWGTMFVLYKSIASTGAPATICFDIDCRSITFNNASGADMVTEAFAVNCLSYCNVSITHTGTAAQFVYIDAFAIFANNPTNTPVPILATWTPQYITPLPTWTAQIPATWTAQPTESDRGERLLTGGNYEEVDVNLNFFGAWTLDLNSSYRNGAAYTTTTQNAYLVFTYNASAVALLLRRITTGDDLEVCVGTSCSTIDGNASNTFQASASIASGLAGDRTVRVRKLTNNANPIYIDAVDITAYATSTPIPTWTAQATWTAQPAGLTPLPTWTAQGRAQYILTSGEYEPTDAGLSFVGSWTFTPTSNSVTATTTSQSDYLTFTFNARFATLFVTKSTSGDDIEICHTSGCTTYDANSTNGVNASILFSNALATDRTVFIRKATNNANPIVIEGVSLQAWATETPLPTWTAQPAGFTPLPTWTAQPAGLTPLPTWTAQIPATWTPQVYYPTPLPTWTAQAITPLPTWTPFPTPVPQYTQIAPLTQIPYPTPLDTWTPQAINIAITFEATFSANLDWTGLLTVFPTLITRVPPTETPTITLTPSITPTPTETPTPTPPGYIQYELPNVQGTPVMTGVLYVEASAGDVGIITLVFMLALSTMLFIVRSWFMSRKAPV